MGIILLLVLSFLFAGYLFITNVSVNAINSIDSKNRQMEGLSQSVESRHVIVPQMNNHMAAFFKIKSLETYVPGMIEISSTYYKSDLEQILTFLMPQHL